MARPITEHECEAALPDITPAECMMCGAELGKYCPICQPWGDCFCSYACEQDYYGDDGGE